MCLREKKNSIEVNNKISLSLSFFGNEVTWSSFPEPWQWVQGLDPPMPAMMIAQKLSKTKKLKSSYKRFWSQERVCFKQTKGEKPKVFDSLKNVGLTAKTQRDSVANTSLI